MKIRYIGLMCIILVVFFLGGCSDDTDDIQVLNVWESDTDIADDETESDFGFSEDVSNKVGMVTDVGGIDDESFNQSAWEGLQALSENKNAVTEYRESDSEDDFAGNFQELVDSGCGLCWGIGFACADALKDAAQNNKRVHFAIVDSSYQFIPENVTAVVFRAQEPSFIVGYIAGSVTKTGKIGFVGGVKGDIIDQFQYGYQAGAEYASELYGKQIDVVIEYADSFADADKGYELADRMYKDGCDIVYQAAGGTGIGVIEAAKKSGKYVIGVDRDQAYLAPENVLTSALKLVNVAVERVSESYIRGEEIGGKAMSFGLAEGAVGIPADHSNYRDEIYDSALVLEDRIKSGDIVPPASEQEYKEFKSSLN